jgi:mannosyl-oligosaccharide alpha-1,2-mannosidase
MGEKEIYLKCRNWVEKNFTFETSSSASFFETTIRILGGFLSTYDLTRDALFLTKATEMGDALLTGIDPKSQIPYPWINFKGRHGSGGSISLAEIGTLQMEFKYLSYLTKDPKYWNAVQTISKRIFDQKSKDGLVAKQWGVANFNVIEAGISIGSGGDSYYE